MSLQAVTDVCRLCPTTTNLVHVFDKRIVNDNMREVVYISTGVEIHEKDIVSQKVCAKCCNIALKMFKFRQDAAKHDKLLKEKCSELLKEKEIKIPNTSITIKREVKPDDTLRKRPPSILPKKQEIETVIKRKKENQIHDSVASLFCLYPNLKLPTKSLKSDILPVVSLKMGEVENYFKSRKLDMKKFIYHPRTRVAKKKTTSITKISEVSVHKGNVALMPENKKRKLSGSEETSKIHKVKHSELSESRKSKQPELKKLHSGLKIKLSGILKHTSSAKLSESEYTRKEISTTKDEPINKSEKSVSSLSNTSSDPSSTLSLVDKSIPLLTCNICGAVEYSAKDLKKHLNKHLVCQFCKTKFKTLDLKTKHVDSYCIVKIIMNSSGPEVSLEKVDLVLDIRKKYPKAFKGFPKHPNIEDKIDNGDYADVLVCNSDSAALDVIELSDDEDLSVPIVSNCIDSKLSSVSNLKCDETLPNTSTNHAPVEENVIYTTVSIVKPDIRIKGNNSLLNRVDPSGNEVNVIKDLISLVKQPKPTTTEIMLQTELPTNKDIILNKDMTCEFKSLKEHLCVYKIPVVIRHGEFKVNYNYHIENKPDKILHNWDILPVVNSKAANSHSVSVNSAMATPNKIFPSSIAGLNMRASYQPNSIVSVSNNFNLNQTNTVTGRVVSMNPIVASNLSTQQNKNSTYYSTLHSKVVPSQNLLYKAPNLVPISTNTVSYNSIGNTVSQPANSTSFNNVAAATSIAPAYSSVVPTHTVAPPAYTPIVPTHLVAPPPYTPILPTITVAAPIFSSVGTVPMVTTCAAQYTSSSPSAFRIAPSSSGTVSVNSVAATTDVSTPPLLSTSAQHVPVRAGNTSNNVENGTPLSSSTTPLRNIRVKSVWELQ